MKTSAACACVRPLSIALLRAITDWHTRPRGRCAGGHTGPQWRSGITGVWATHLWVVEPEYSPACSVLLHCVSSWCGPSFNFRRRVTESSGNPHARGLGGGRPTGRRTASARTPWGRRPCAAQDTRRGRDHPAGRGLGSGLSLSRLRRASSAWRGARAARGPHLGTRTVIGA